ncbi:phosphatase YcdX [uncultured archaeon]|nr:phosphatase YcdX [uncultured archaeon]
MKKPLINHHVHTTGSDGKLSPEDTIKLAIEKGLNFICFTDHYPCPDGFDKWFCGFHSEEYYANVMGLKQKYKDRIDISFGAEVNWFLGHEDWIKKEVKKRKYDYILGAAHHLGRPSHLSINNSEKNWNETIKHFGSIEELIKEYYTQVRLMAKSGLFDCIAHFDLVKVWNEDSKYFSEDEKWYRQEVIKTLETIKESGICIEINTSGRRKKSRDEHPSFWILEETGKMKIPLTIGSDSHNPSDIDYGLERAMELAKKADYSDILIFKERKPIQVKI